MANSPSGNSIEVQIDNFLEQFKRSASKAMEGEWPTTSSSGTSSMIQSKSRLSMNCFEAVESSGECCLPFAYTICLFFFQSTSFCDALFFHVFTKFKRKGICVSLFYMYVFGRCVFLFE